MRRLQLYYRICKYNAESASIAHGWRLSVVHEQVTLYCQRVLGYITWYSQCQPDCVSGQEENHTAPPFGEFNGRFEPVVISRSPQTEKHAKLIRTTDVRLFLTAINLIICTALPLQNGPLNILQ